MDSGVTSLGSFSNCALNCDSGTPAQSAGAPSIAPRKVVPLRTQPPMKMALLIMGAD